MELVRLFVLGEPDEGVVALALRKAASTSGVEQDPLTAWAAMFSGFCLVHSSKSAPERSASQSTACIGSNAGCAAKWLHRRWLKSANASIPLSIRTTAAALVGANRLSTSMTGVKERNSRNSWTEALASAGRLDSIEASPSVSVARKSPIRVEEFECGYEAQPKLSALVLGF